MILDNLNTFCDSTAIGASTGRRLLGSVITLNKSRDVGQLPGAIKLIVQVATTFTSGGSGTLQIEFASDAQAAIAVDGTASVHAVSKSFPVAELTAGKKLMQISLPADADTPYERFLGIIGNVGTAAMTAGAITAFLTTETPGGRRYPAGKL